MKHQKTIIFLVVFTFLAFLPSLISFFTQSTSAQTNKSQIATVKNKTIPPSSRIRKKISGAVAPNQIPDNVAYELFLRTVAEGNARGLVKRAGLNDEEIEMIMSAAYSLSSALEISDRRAQELKNNQAASNKIQPKTELLRLQQKKDDFIDATVNRYLPNSLNDEARKKLQNFLKTEVKGNVQKIFVTNDSVQTKEVAFAKTSAARQSSGGQLYLYSTGWNDGISVYGSGSISEQYSSGTSYLVRVTVTSPLGRSNTTQSDWSYAAVINDTGLSIGDEDGTYTIQADFEEQLGYYDEYGNFYGTGSSFVGNSTDDDEVAPSITLANLIFTQPSIPPVTGSTSNLIATVIYSRSVPQNTTVAIELNDAPTGQGNPLYTISAPTFDPTNGGVVTGNTNRTARLTVPATTTSPRSVRVTFPFTVGANSGSGTVTANVRLGGVVVPSPLPTPIPSPGTVTVIPPTGLNAVLTIAAPPTPTPTPSPSPSPVAGNCNPSNILLGWCYAGGGDWLYPPPSSQCRCSETIEKSPILIDTTENGFAMTNAANGVLFDLLGFGFPLQLSWTAPNSDDAWLALDRNQNNRIDNGKELFGNATQQPAPPEGEERQGFLALARYDKPANGGNDDGRITRSDTVFRKLRLWQDRNHNGISEAEELSRLPALDVVAIFLDYKESRRTDEFGNRFKYRAKIRDARGARVGRWAWDVFLVTEP